MNQKMFQTDAPAHYDNRLFLAQVLAHGAEEGKIAHDNADAIHQEITTLSYKLITIKAENFSSRSELRKHAQEAFIRTSLGLEYGSQGALDKAVRLLNKNRIIKFFQIGNTLVDKLVERSQNALKNAILLPPETLEIPVYNEWERQFMKGILEHKLVIDTPQVILREISSPRPLTRLADLTSVNTQLHHIEHRLSYMQALPLERVFAAEYPPNVDGDIVCEITMALMVNLILYREVDFHLDVDDLQNFRDIAYDAESGEIRKTAQERLFGWIEHYLDLAGQPDEVKAYTVAYWRECLKFLTCDPGF